MVGDKIFVNKLGNFFKEPERGEVIVFRYPLDTSQDFIKRVIGLPGETIEIRDSVVYIDDVPLKENYLPPNLVYPDFQKVLIPDSCYFMMGDNRSNSQDSRVWGPLSRDLVKGKAVATFWPVSRIGAIR